MDGYVLSVLWGKRIDALGETGQRVLSCMGPKTVDNILKQHTKDVRMFIGF
jgi:hypothetical protein